MLRKGSASAVLAAYLHLGRFALPVALGIATAKAGLVALVFMEQARAGAAARFAAAAGVLWLLLQLGLTFADVTTRAPSDAAAQAAAAGAG